MISAAKSPANRHFSLLQQNSCADEKPLHSKLHKKSPRCVFTSAKAFFYTNDDEEPEIFIYMIIRHPHRDHTLDLNSSASSNRNLYFGSVSFIRSYTSRSYPISANIFAVSYFMTIVSEYCCASLFKILFIVSSLLLNSLKSVSYTHLRVSLRAAVLP